MTEASLQIDFRPQPRAIAVVTSAPISSIIENGHYSAFQDLIDGYAASFAKVIIVSPSGSSTVTVKKTDRVSWFSGPRWLSPLNGLWWATVANHRELRNVELIRTFGPRAGLIGSALSRFSKSPHVSSADDMVGNSWHDRSVWRSMVPRLVNRLGVLRADVLSATLDWELEYLAGTGYVNDLLLGSQGLPTDIYTPVGTTDPDRHPVVLWAGNVTGDDSISLITGAAASTRKLIPNVEFIVVAEGESAELLRSASIEQDLPVTVASFADVEPLVDLIERTWACITVPNHGRSMPHGLAMLTLSAGKPLISVGDLGESHGFQNHLNYIRVEPEDSGEVAYGLQLLRRWSSFALRIGSAGQRLVEERYSTRAVALIEGEQLSRIAAGLNVDAEMSDGARTLQEFPARFLPEVELPEEDVDDAGSDSELEEEKYASAGFDLVAAAIASVNGSRNDDGETKPANADTGGETGEGDGLGGASSEQDAEDSADDYTGADRIAALFAEDDVSTDSGDPSSPVVPVDNSSVLGQDAISALFGGDPAETAPGEADDESGTGQDTVPDVIAISEELLEGAIDSKVVSSLESYEGDTGVLDQGAISALLGSDGADDQPEAAIEPAEQSSSNNDDEDIRLTLVPDTAPAPEPGSSLEDGDDNLPEINVIKVNIGDIKLRDDVEADESGAFDQDAISALFASDGDDDDEDQAEPATESAEPVTAEADESGAFDQDAISALFASDGEDIKAA